MFITEKKIYFPYYSYRFIPEAYVLPLICKVIAWSTIVVKWIKFSIVLPIEVLCTSLGSQIIIVTFKLRNPNLPWASRCCSRTKPKRQWIAKWGRSVNVHLKIQQMLCHLNEGFNMLQELWLIINNNGTLTMLAGVGAADNWGAASTRRGYRKWVGGT